MLLLGRTRVPLEPPLALTQGFRLPDLRGPATLPSACRTCGIALDTPDRMYCIDCLPEFKADRTQKLVTAARSVLAERIRSRVEVRPEHRCSTGLGGRPLPAPLHLVSDDHWRAKKIEAMADVQPSGEVVASSASTSKSATKMSMSLTT